MTGDQPWTENSPRGVSEERPWVVLWRARELVAYFALRDLKLRYRQAVLGTAWVLLQPLVTVAIFTLVFERIAGLGSQGIPYPLFALVGMVTWTFFATAATAASQSLVGNANLVTKVHFPRMAAPAAALVRPAVDLAVSMSLVVILALHYGVFSGIRLLAVPGWLLLLTLTTFGVALWLSALNVRYRDVQQGLTPLLQLGLLASPVAYPSTLLGGWQELVYSLNPMVGVIETGRWALLGVPWPGWSSLVSTTVAGVLLVTGFAYFHRAQRSFADVI